jgi:hypothetical protein
MYVLGRGVRVRFHPHVRSCQIADGCLLPARVDGDWGDRFGSEAEWSAGVDFCQSASRKPSIETDSLVPRDRDPSQILRMSAQ